MLTERCHKPSIQLLEGLFRQLRTMQRGRAIEVGCGDGKFSRDLLFGWFDVVDFLDVQANALEKVHELKATSNKVGRIREAMMQQYEFEDVYNAIVLRWSIGYLDDWEGVQFLMKAKQALRSPSAVRTRKAGFSSFIFIMDNLLEAWEAEETDNGERQRHEWKLEELFQQAGL